MDELLDYEGLIYSIINKYPKRFDREDLYQVSMIGLIDAYRHFDASQHTKFSSFAYYYIVGEVNKYIRESSSLKVGRDFIQLKKKIIETRDIMMQRLGREPTNVEVSLFLEVDENLIDQALLATEDVESLDDVYNLGAYYDDMSADILDLHHEIENLPEGEKQLILSRYFEDLTQREVSHKLGMSQVQVSRSEAKILQKLRERL